jgi:hypothetical protein
MICIETSEYGDTAPRYVEGMNREVWWQATVLNS